MTANTVVVASVAGDTFVWPIANICLNIGHSDRLLLWMDVSNEIVQLGRKDAVEFLRKYMQKTDLQVHELPEHWQQALREDKQPRYIVKRASESTYIGQARDVVREMLTTHAPKAAVAELPLPEFIKAAIEAIVEARDAQQATRVAAEESCGNCDHWTPGRDGSADPAHEGECHSCGVIGPADADNYCSDWKRKEDAKPPRCGNCANWQETQPDRGNGICRGKQSPAFGEAVHAQSTCSYHEKKD